MRIKKIAAIILVVEMLVRFEFVFVQRVCIWWPCDFRLLRRRESSWQVGCFKDKACAVAML